MVNADFFDIDPIQATLEGAHAGVPLLDAVVGNPPFIRYHRFKGAARKRAQQRASDEGVQLNGLSSSWASFVVHAASFLKSGGRLAMVVPGEIMHTSYSMPVLRFLTRTFQDLYLLSFRKKLFSELSQDTALLLAEHRGRPFRSLRVVDVEDVEKLPQLRLSGTDVDVRSILDGNVRLIEYLLPTGVRDLYSKLKGHPRVKRLRDFATVGIGYVTGNNDFFHLTRSGVLEHGIPDEFLRKCVRKSSQLEGVLFTETDLHALIDSGSASYLLDLSRVSEDIPEPIRRYLQRGETQGVHEAFKCRVRKPWWKVPHIYECDGLLTYLGGTRIRLVANEAHVVAPNSLHIVRLTRSDERLMRALAVTWLSSLTALSTEIEGRSLGGGLLKMEPSEAARTLLVAPDAELETLAELAEQVDQLVRHGQWDQAQDLVDSVVLQRILLLGHGQIELLRQGTRLLRHRRMSR
ncbi:MAG: hypothetical protein HXY34_07635 [Candidatus Thorarchaeota archaeon]|nr:hypothetical protein [Candidatus Thorarchaeota archaeon]